ncbi:hypothetical protein TcBrA4_0023010 [Trypanosoma cruzi]|nr:hypothetical protein TcBrA4_0023010 [Trypanosoma cruzi]
MSLLTERPTARLLPVLVVWLPVGENACRDALPAAGVPRGQGNATGPRPLLADDAAFLFFLLLLFFCSSVRQGRGGAAVLATCAERRCAGRAAAVRRWRVPRWGRLRAGVCGFSRGGRRGALSFAPHARPCECGVESTDRREKELLRVRTGIRGRVGCLLGGRSAVAPCVVRDAAGPIREKCAPLLAATVCAACLVAHHLFVDDTLVWRVFLRRALLVVDVSRSCAHWQCRLLHRGARAGCPVLSGEARSQQCFPHEIVVADAGLTASTSVRTSCLVPGHSCDTTRCEGMCYHCAGITIYLGKHAGNNRSKSVRAAANLHGCSFTFSTRENEVVRPAPVVMHSHSHVLNGACCCFSEAGSVCQRDRRTWLVVAGVFPGTALECWAPSVGRSPRRGRLSGIVSRLLLNAVVVVVDGKSLMGEREIVCCRVISDSDTRWSDACVYALRLWCF